MENIPLLPGDVKQPKLPAGMFLEGLQLLNLQMSSIHYGLDLLVVYCRMLLKKRLMSFTRGNNVLPAEMLVISAFSLPLSLKKKPEGNFASVGLIKNVANQNLTGKGQFYIGFKGQCPNLLLSLNLLLQVWSLNRSEQWKGN